MEEKSGEKQTIIRKCDDALNDTIICVTKYLMLLNEKAEIV